MTQGCPQQAQPHCRDTGQLLKRARPASQTKRWQSKGAFPSGASQATRKGAATWVESCAQLRYEQCPSSLPAHNITICHNLPCL